MKAQSKAQVGCDVKVAIDKGSIRLSFPKRHTPLWELMDGKSLKGKPKYLYLGKAGFSATNPDDCRRAELIAVQMESDLDHPEWDKLFDRTLEKYGLAGLLGGKYAKLADVLQLPGIPQVEPEITVGTMWEAYLEWKEKRVEPSTFLNFKVIYTNALKGLKWDKRTHIETDRGIMNESICSPTLKSKAQNLPIGKENQMRILLALNECCDLAIERGETKINPFKGLLCDYKPDARDKYKPSVTASGDVLSWWKVQDSALQDKLDSDKRAFTKVERDIIVKAFYESDKSGAQQIAPLIEFLFLTGCRPGEAFALRWGDIKTESGIIWFSKALGRRTKEAQVTKNKTIRMFKLYPPLIELLNTIKPTIVDPSDLVFKQSNGKGYYTELVHAQWNGNTYKNRKTGGIVATPGVVTRLVDEGKISQYLAPYHTRHTYITLTAWANKGDTSALMLLAHSCENSVEVIVAHYLGIDESATLNWV
ncbi:MULTISPECIES: site-specific integrase [unclassified Microcoleus]|uniref:site-specific integrase n=1 Tax=unclassified Microcoleus TaxID=2642155 RepID=UPI0025CF2D3E|nr:MULTISPECIES: site-specific integrase [unclassified Microcoleus]